MKHQPDQNEYEMIFTSWKEQYGVEVRSKKYGTPFMVVPKDPILRREMLICLIDTLCSDPYNFEEKDFGTFVKGLIIDNCVFKEYENTKQLGKWKDSVKLDLNIALATVFKKQFVKKEREIIERPQEVSRPTFIEQDNTSELQNPLDKSKLNHIAEPIDIPDLEFLEELEGKNE